MSKFSVGDLVEVKYVSGVSAIDKEKIDGAKARVSRIEEENPFGFIYHLAFENKELSEYNHSRGSFVFKDEELTEYKIHKDMIDQHGNRILIRQPAVIYFAETDLGIMKGVAKCMPDDNFSQDTGIELAFCKAMKKYWNKRYKVATK